MKTTHTRRGCDLLPSATPIINRAQQDDLLMHLSGGRPFSFSMSFETSPFEYDHGKLFKKVSRLVCMNCLPYPASAKREVAHSHMIIQRNPMTLATICVVSVDRYDCVEPALYECTNWPLELIQLVNEYVPREEFRVETILASQCGPYSTWSISILRIGEALKPGPITMASSFWYDYFDFTREVEPAEEYYWFSDGLLDELEYHEWRRQQNVTTTSIAATFVRCDVASAYRKLVLSQKARPKPLKIQPITFAPKPFKLPSLPRFDNMDREYVAQKPLKVPFAAGLDAAHAAIVCFYAWNSNPACMRVLQSDYFTMWTSFGKMAAGFKQFLENISVGLHNHDCQGMNLKNVRCSLGRLTYRIGEAKKPGPFNDLIIALDVVNKIDNLIKWQLTAAGVLNEHGMSELGYELQFMPAPIAHKVRQRWTNPASLMTDLTTKTIHVDYSSDLSAAAFFYRQQYGPPQESKSSSSSSTAGSGPVSLPIPHTAPLHVATASAGMTEVACTCALCRSNCKPAPVLVPIRRHSLGGVSKLPRSILRNSQNLRPIPPRAVPVAPSAPPVQAVFDTSHTADLDLEDKYPDDGWSDGDAAAFIRYQGGHPTMLALTSGNRQPASSQPSGSIADHLHDILALPRPPSGGLPSDNSDPPGSSGAGRAAPANAARPPGAPMPHAPAPGAPVIADMLAPRPQPLVWNSFVLARMAVTLTPIIMRHEKPAEILNAAIMSANAAIAAVLNISEQKGGENIIGKHGVGALFRYASRGLELTMQGCSTVLQAHEPGYNDAVVALAEFGADYENRYRAQNIFVGPRPVSLVEYAQNLALRFSERLGFDHGRRYAPSDQGDRLTDAIRTGVHLVPSLEDFHLAAGDRIQLSQRPSISRRLLTIVASCAILTGLGMTLVFQLRKGLHTLGAPLQAFTSNVMTLGAHTRPLVSGCLNLALLPVRLLGNCLKICCFTIIPSLNPLAWSHYHEQPF